MSGVIVLLLLAGGGYWLWTWAFPSESSRLYSSSSAQSRIIRNQQTLRESLKIVKTYSYKDPLTSDDLTRAGRELEAARQLAKTTSNELSSLKNNATSLKKSNHVSTRLQATGYERFAHEKESWLKAYNEYLEELESKSNTTCSAGKAQVRREFVTLAGSLWSYPSFHQSTR